ncbi:MAG: hypothetical protein M1153_00675, partial [Patescibacteria group bacterium]|nr:hypothetical protein [Patescibacteria group bacterium]
MKKGFEFWKTIAGAVILLLILAGVLYVYHRRAIAPGTESVAAQDSKAISSLVHGYYYQYMNAVDGNSGWNKLIANYTTSTASLTVASNGQSLIDAAVKHEQFWISSSTAIDVRLFAYSGNRAEVLADGQYAASVVGFQPAWYQISQFLDLEKINGRWYI